MTADLRVLVDIVLIQCPLYSKSHITSNISTKPYSISLFNKVIKYSEKNNYLKYATAEQLKLNVSI